MLIPIAHTFRILGFCSALDYSWDSTFRCAGESHNFWEVVCVLDGQVEVAEDEKIYILGPGDLIFHGSMEFHRIGSARGTSPHVLVMSFTHEGTLPQTLLGGVYHLSGQELEAYRMIFADIFRYCRHCPDDALLGTEVSCSLGRFLIRLSRRDPGTGSRSKSRAASEYQQLIETMSAALCENITLPELSRRTGISVSVMKNLFQKYAGMGPKAYYAQLRGLEGRRRLEEGQEIREIAEQMNYSSPNYFNLCFKQQFGVPPGSWRRQQETGGK